MLTHTSYYKVTWPRTWPAQRREGAVGDGTDHTETQRTARSLWVDDREHRLWKVMQRNTVAHAVWLLGELTGPQARPRVCVNVISNREPLKVLEQK